MRYYYYDLAENTDLQEYADRDEFQDGLLWNRDVAKQYGDDVPTRKELLKDINSNEEFAVELNGAIFIACEDITKFEGGMFADE